MNKLFSKENSKPSLPLLTIDTTAMSTAYLDTNPTKGNSPMTTKYKTTKTLKFGFKKPKKGIDEDDGIYKLSEINKVKNDRNLPNVTCTNVKRMWDAYPKKENVLQEVRRQYSAFLHTKKAPSLTEETIDEPKKAEE